MKKVVITKCDLCRKSINKKGVLVCPFGGCILSKEEHTEILKAIGVIRREQNEG